MITVITPTTGHPRLKHAIESVQQQHGAAFRHLIVVDGRERLPRTEAILEQCNFNGDIVVLPSITGRGGFNGHVIYSITPLIGQSDYFALLDEDNAFAPEHLSSLLVLCEEHKLDWAYSLRDVHGDEGDPIHDDCQSLGWWPAYNGPYHLIDTSCYFLRRRTFKAGGAIWDRPASTDMERGPEYVFCEWLFHAFPRGFTTGEYTLKYWLGSRGDDAAGGRMRFFRMGNAVQSLLYRHYPWRLACVSDRSHADHMRCGCRDEQIVPELLRLQDLYLRDPEEAVTLVTRSEP